MFAYFSDERMAKWQSFGYSLQVYWLLPAYNRLNSFASCSDQFDQCKRPVDIILRVL